MGILDRLFGGGGTRAKGQAQRERDVEVVPLADRRPVRSFKTELVGVADPNHDGGSRQATIRRCAPGEEVVLMQEPRRRAQPAVIGVWAAATGEQLGHLPIDAGGYIIMHARRNDFRSVIHELPEQEDGTLGVTLLIEVYEKQQ